MGLKGRQSRGRGFGLDLEGTGEPLMVLNRSCISQFVFQKNYLGPLLDSGPEPRLVWLGVDGASLQGPFL